MKQQLVTTHRFTRIESSCPACLGGTSLAQIGVDCGACGHHFHIGGDILLSPRDLACPRCEAVCATLQMKDQPPQEEQ